MGDSGATVDPGCSVVGVFVAATPAGGDSPAEGAADPPAAPEGVADPPGGVGDKDVDGDGGKTGGLGVSIAITIVLPAVCPSLVSIGRHFLRIHKLASERRNICMRRIPCLGETQCCARRRD